MDILSTKLKLSLNNLALYYIPNIQYQLHTHSQHHHRQVQLEVQHQELDQHVASARKHEILGGATYTLVISLHKKLQEI